MRDDFSTSATAMEVVQKRPLFTWSTLIIVFIVVVTICASDHDGYGFQSQPIAEDRSAILQRPSRASVIIREHEPDGSSQKKKNRKRRSKNINRNKSGKHQKTVSQNPSTSGGQTNKPEQTEMKRAGEYKGDVRDLPQTPPVVRERPKREDPKITRKIYKKPAAQKDN